MNKRDLMLKVNERGFYLTNGALRTYTSNEFQLIIPIVSG